MPIIKYFMISSQEKKNSLKLQAFINIVVLITFNLTSQS
jgi:hypothetical protein